MNVLEKLAQQASSHTTHTGELQITQTGYLILQVPNALVRGQFAALDLPGISLPPSPGDRFNAHITVMTPAEVDKIGGGSKISERGRHYQYSAGILQTERTDNRNSHNQRWREVGRTWFLPVRSPELVQLRKSYGLEPQPRFPFHITVAVRYRNVLREGPTTKAAMCAAFMALQSRGGLNYVLDRIVVGRNASDRTVPCSQTIASVITGQAKAAGESSPQGSVDVPAIASDALAQLLEKLSSTVTYSRTLAQAVKRTMRPTEAQAEAGNYQKGHIRIQGLNIAIETPKGRRRKPEWPPLQNHYGYIKGTVGKDGDHVDVFIGPQPKSTRVYVVDQTNPKSGTFDEHKVMLGFSTKDEAQKAYLANYSKGWDGMGTVTALDILQFRAWLADGDQTKPMADQTLKIKAAAAEEVIHLVLQTGGGVTIVAPAKNDISSSGLEQSMSLMALS